MYLYLQADALCLRMKFLNRWLDNLQCKYSLASHLLDVTGVQKGQEKASVVTDHSLGRCGCTLGLCVPVLGTHGKILVLEGYRGGLYGSCQELNLTDSSPHSHSLSTTEGRR